MGEREEFQDEIEINIEIMRAWKYLLKKEFRQFLRDPGLPRIVMTFPVLIVFVFPFAVTMELRNIRLAVIDNDRSSESSLLVEKCVNSGYFILEDICPTQQAARSMMDKGDIDAVLTINTGFSKYLGGGAQLSDPLPVGIAVNTVNGTRGSIVSKYLTACISSFIAKQKSSGGADSGTSVSSPSIEVSYMFNPYLDYKLFMLPALMVIVVTMMCGFLPALNIVGEKEKGTIEQINVTPVSKSAFVICKMIPYVVVAYIVVFTCLLLTRIGFGYSCQGSLLLIALFTLAHIVVMASFGLLISNFSENTQQAMFVIWFFSMVFMLMSGIFTPIASMPRWAEIITYANPLRYFADAMRSIYLKGGTLIDNWSNLACLAGIGTLTTFSAIMSYKKTN